MVKRMAPVTNGTIATFGDKTTLISNYQLGNGSISVDFHTLKEAGITPTDLRLEEELLKVKLTDPRIRLVFRSANSVQELIEVLEQVRDDFRSKYSSALSEHLERYSR